MLIILKNKDTLIFDDFKFRCCVGKNGFSKRKVEGDKKTPTGLFSLGHLYYRADKKEKPDTKLKTIKILNNMGWCNDSSSREFYNKIINTSLKVKHEKLRRNDFKYDYFLHIKYSKILVESQLIVICIKTKPSQWTPGDAWWDVGVPEVSDREEVRQARADHTEGQKRQRLGV